MELYHSRNTPSWRGAQLKKCTGTTLPVPGELYGVLNKNSLLRGVKAVRVCSVLALSFVSYSS